VRQAEQALRLYFVNFHQRTDWHRLPASAVVDEHGRTSPLPALEQLRLRIRTRHYAYRTEGSYVDWPSSSRPRLADCPATREVRSGPRPRGAGALRR
jgi:hypothetical protein